MMILLFIYLLIYFGVWLTLKISSNYNVFLSCRQLYNILLWGVYIMACIGFSLCLVNYQNVTRNTFSVEKVGIGRLFLAAYASLPFSVYIFKGFQQKEFHDSSHIKPKSVIRKFCFHFVLKLNERYINSSLKFEIKAKQFYAASQRVL